jgi:hypothetical protein
MAADPYDLDRFVQAQRDTYQHALAELRAGHKRSHWMWFIFPQCRGLGSSARSHCKIASGTDALRNRRRIRVNRWRILPWPRLGGSRDQARRHVG